MFARLARASRRNKVLRQTVLISTPLVGTCALTQHSIRNESPKQSLKDGSDQSGLRPGFWHSSQPSSDRTELDDDDPSDPGWASFSRRFSEAGDAVASFDWSSLGSKVRGFIVPRWAMVLPGYIRKIQAELEWRPGSLAAEIMQEATDAEINPEIEWTAQVRTGTELCAAELAFQKRRQKHIVAALARYLDIPESDIHPDDVPVIGMCGSGGGLRALVAGANSSLCTQEAGLFDCVMYTAGVSGSCWMQALYHSSIGKQDFQHMLNHLKKRIGIHIAFPPPALNLLASAPTNKYLLSGLLEKSQADPDADFGLVDVYGLLLAARLLVPRGELEVDPRDLKISNQRLNTDDGSHPLPIYTAVRHEIPQESDETSEDKTRLESIEKERKKTKQGAWFQWFEWTPYEFWCEEIEAGIPTWSLGRIFRDGSSLPRENGLGLPEMRVPQLMGIWGSAFCATLSHYYAEIRPLVKGLAGFGGINDLIEERDADLVKVHPIDPATIPNFAKGLHGKLPSSTPESILNDSHLQLMDAGMSNNLPIYPLLRPGRNVDVLIAFDASADPRKDNWLAKVDGYARQRGIAGWPMGAGWPPEKKDASEAAEDLEMKKELKDEDAQAQMAAAKAEQSRDTRGAKELGHCTIWFGTTQELKADGGKNDDAMEREQSPSASSESESQSSSPSTSSEEDSSSAGPDSSSSPASSTSSRTSNSNGNRATTPSFNPSPHHFSHAPDSASWQPLPPTSGLAVIYFPLTANPEKAPDIDPMTSSVLSTWNFIYSPQEVDAVGTLARANWDEGAEQTRRCVHAVYERKRRARLQREMTERSARDEGFRSGRERVWRARFGDGDGLL